MNDINICIKLIKKSQLIKASFYTYTKATYTTPKAAPPAKPATLPKEGENFEWKTDWKELKKEYITDFRISYI